MLTPTAVEIISKAPIIIKARISAGLYDSLTKKESYEKTTNL